jgi:hypothetical protein
MRRGFWKVPFIEFPKVKIGDTSIFLKSCEPSIKKAGPHKITQSA